MLQAVQRVNLGFHSSETIRGLAVEPLASSLLKHSSTVTKYFSPELQLGRQSGKKTCGPIHAAFTNSSNNSSNISYTQAAFRHPFIKLIAKVTIRRKRHQSLNERVVHQIDSFSDLAGQKVFLQLVSVEVDPKTGVAKRSGEVALEDWAAKANIKADKIQYTAEFKIHRKDFGLPGAIIVSNSHQSEFYLETISLEGLPSGTIYFACYSWVPSNSNNSEKRVFFSNQTYLPSHTPSGLKDLREKELRLLRGNGKGIRNPWDRVYDYDIYNDLGNPDKGKEFERPSLGANKNFPYPRRCRTGRLQTKTDPCAESVLGLGMRSYVPRDEAFEQVKQETFLANAVRGMIHQLVSSSMNRFTECNDEFHSFGDIDRLYQDEIILEDSNCKNEFLKRLFSQHVLKDVQVSANEITSLLRYAQPDVVSRDKFAWLRDDEFGRQVLAGVNPLQIERMQVFPPRSNLDPELFGSKESSIKAKHVEGRLGGLSIQQAIDDGRLFLLDYHDTFMPFVHKINLLNGRKMYASRTIFFLTASGTLMPIVIELSLPPVVRGAPGTKRVFTPGYDSTTNWEWQLAKAHASSNDAGFHQLVNHWLRSHATAEPYVIATHRNLSCMHPIWKLLQPHFRYTLEINASARQHLISADGVIENCFTPGRYSVDISSAAYAALWRFDQESLPADLIKRGMAVEDSSQPEGLKLVIEDYPYAADGLLIWSAIKKWVNQYVSFYYHDHQSVQNDSEIQKWWEEIRCVGHSDKKDESWWPELRTPEDLKGILTTMIWIVSGFHAAVNFGQYAYTGYVPNRPCMTRRLIPEEGSVEYQEFVEDPERFFLSTIPNHVQATTTMAVLDTLSTHSPDEQYLGQRVQTNWTADKKAMELSYQFANSMDAIENEIRSRNKDPRLRNRFGAGIIPYELLIPSSAPGRTGRGVPNSISI